jgi:hypothetical protein
MTLIMKLQKIEWKGRFLLISSENLPFIFGPISLPASSRDFIFSVLRVPKYSANYTKLSSYSYAFVVNFTVNFDKSLLLLIKASALK